jgi:hypothetical protein
MTLSRVPFDIPRAPMKSLAFSWTVDAVGRAAYVLRHDFIRIAVKALIFTDLVIIVLAYVFFIAASLGLLSSRIVWLDKPFL